MKYFRVSTLFPLQSIRRTQCTPISSSKQALQLAKLNLSSISTNTVIPFLIEIFRRLNALSTPFCAPNAVHADFTIETSPATRKLNLSLTSTNTVISFLIELFRRLNALCTPFFAPIAVHAVFSVETSPATRKTQSFLDIDENCYFVPD
jgi:hypothetical protein